MLVWFIALRRSLAVQKSRKLFFFRDLPWACLPLNQNNKIIEALLFILTQTTNLSSVPGTTWVWKINRFFKLT